MEAKDYIAYGKCAIKYVIRCSMINTACVKVGHSVWTQVRNHVRHQVEHQVWDRVYYQVWLTVSGKVRDQVWYD